MKLKLPANCVLAEPDPGTVITLIGEVVWRQQQAMQKERAARAGEPLSVIEQRKRRSKRSPPKISPR